MIIDCIADLHGFEPDLEGGDLLILAGDYTGNDSIKQWAKFFEWLKQQQYDKKILIAGNHDGMMYKSFPKDVTEAHNCKEIQEYIDESNPDFEYLCDYGCSYKGIKIWGTPWTPWFNKVNPMCAYFMLPDQSLASKFDNIPEGLDILVTHGPMLGILDSNVDEMACGSYELRKSIDRAKPKYHVFGHIHERGSQRVLYKHAGPNTMCINCSYVNERYRPVNKHFRIVI